MHVQRQKGIPVIIHKDPIDDRKAYNGGKKHHYFFYNCPYFLSL